MIYLVGGSARCGKTTLVRSLRKGFDGQVLSGDSTRVAIRETSKPEWLPDVFDNIVDPTSEDDPPQKRIARFRRRDEVVWNFFQKYFESVAFANDNVMVEGPIWPSMFHAYEPAHRAVFLIDTSVDHAKRVMHIRDTAVHDNWMRDFNYTDEAIVKWAELNIERSKMIAAECEKYGYKYFDIVDHGLDGSQKLAAEYLMGDF